MRITSNTHLRMSAAVAIAFAGLMAGSTAATAGPLADSDGDRMPNVWETNHGLNPNRANANGNPDHDGLRNLGEYRN